MQNRTVLSTYSFIGYCMQNILGKHILLITAHPDDESYIAAGYIYKNVAAGGTVDLYCASHGEKGISHAPVGTTSEQLSDIRKTELEKACGFLGVRTLWLREFPDGNITEFGEKVFEDVKALCTEQGNKYDYVMSFGPDGFTGHKDHIAIAGIAIRLADCLKLPLLQFTLPTHLRKSFFDCIKQKRKLGCYTETEQVELTTSLITVDVDPEVKTRAVRFHKSQLAGEDPFAFLPDEIRDEFKTTESFYIQDSK